MKKIALCLSITLGIFLALGSVSAASPAETLQPASDIEYTETLIVPSIKIGKQGVGGVTFFNGTIINATTDVDTGVDQPVTFGDNVRVDGRIHRGENYGPGLNDGMPFIINDEAEVAGSLTVGNLLGVGVVNSKNILDGTIIGSDISSSANLSVNKGTFAGTVTTGALSSSTGTFSGDIEAQGDINQSRTKGGAVKAMVDCYADGTIGKYWSYDGNIVTCRRVTYGSYVVGFGFKVDDRFYQGTSWSSQKNISVGATSTVLLEKQLYVHSHSVSTGNPSDARFNLLVY